MPPLPAPIKHTIEAIQRAYEARANFGDSLGVAMSQVNNECSRAIWYDLHWASPPEAITAAKQRIFDTGKIEEERLLDDLERAGVDITRLDPTTGKQFRVELAAGWLRGKLDGVGVGFLEAPKTEHVIECKSHNDNSFKELKKGLELGKPDHYAQCQAYMRAMGLDRCFYIAVNKNDDHFYTERIKYDATYAAKLELKIERIVQAEKAPPKLHEDPSARAAFKCQWCKSRPQCHEGQFARVNCRTCISCTFKDGAVVYCEYWEKELTYDEQQVGCDEHRYLPSLVPGEQVNADEAKRTVTYKMHADGVEWVDGPYNADKDLAGCFNVGYAAVRERVAAGGKGWRPK